MSEQCDDGNSVDGDGCSSCTVEIGWRCEGEPSRCADIDECLEGVDDCSASATCINVPGSFQCECETGYEGDGKTCRSICGDGVVTADEGCDDSGVMPGDGCSAFCAVEHGATCFGSPSVCGLVSVSLATGQSACAISSAGQVKCWGPNGVGQLGLGDFQDRGEAPGEMGRALPTVDLGTGRTATAVALRYAHTCALLDNKSVKCWGANQFGELGLGDTRTRGDAPREMGDNLPAVDLGTGRTARSVAVGTGYSCALLDDSSIKCWGAAASLGLGLGDSLHRGDGPGEMGDNLPAVNLGSGRTAKAVAAGSHACAVLDDDSVKCWGNNSSGELGLGDTANRGQLADDMGDLLPRVELGTGRKAKMISAGFFHTCAVLDDDSVKCWGNNAYGQLGIGTTTNRGTGSGQMGDNLPVVQLGTGRTAKAVSAGWLYTCALLDDDSVKCWGYNKSGELGLGDRADRGDEPGEMGDNLPPVQLGTQRRALMIMAGNSSCCALLDDGSIKCWGYNGQGQLGLGDAEDRGDQPNEMGDNLAPVVLAFSSSSSSWSPGAGGGARAARSGGAVGTTSLRKLEWLERTPK